jgi:hypothetical protein
LLAAEIVDAAAVERLWEFARTETDRAVSAADAGPFEEVGTLLRHVTAPSSPAPTPRGASEVEEVTVS